MVFLVSVGAIGDANGLGLARVGHRPWVVRCMYLVFAWALTIESSTREKASGKTLARHGLHVASNAAVTAIIILAPAVVVMASTAAVVVVASAAA